MSIVQKVFAYLSLVFLVACSNSYDTNTFFSMGTVVEVTLPSRYKDQFLPVRKRIDELSYLVVSNTDKLNRAGIFEEVQSEARFVELLKRSGFFYSLTNGRFDVTIYTVMKLYGFPDGPFSVPNDAILRKSYAEVGFEKIKISGDTLIKEKQASIDLGAYAKGWIVDEAISLLKKMGVKEGIINAGGDMFCLGDKGGKGWRIGVQHPDDKKKVLAIVRLADKAIATSGDYERFFIEKGKKYIHIFDALTKQPVDRYRSVSVIADSTEMADGLSTAYFLMSPDEVEKSCQKLNTPVLLYLPDGRMKKLCGWEQYEVRR
ncbi:MAG: FAD:protein FMN transferase [Calditerrivibrio sp.]|nr:FAD:protein FMN transferase [Calditerrivibrio sp.]